MSTSAGQRSDAETVRAFCEAREWDPFHGPDQLAIGLVTEAAELLELFRFKDASQVRELLSTEPGRAKVAAELADVYFFLLRFADRNGFDLSTALRDKLVENEKKYPVEKARGRNLKYDEL